ncbi:MAG: type IV secretory system conjugative DNA transfer family protein [Candidatus Marsarchaeota archaeon]|nr:type IV secretory system conjugative DNA transfer family protein [Candidatus Marsarchaeota archaeon]
MTPNWTFLRDLLFGDPTPIPNVSTDTYEGLYFEGLTMGTLYVGRQGTGKTSSLARHIVDYFMAFPDRAIFVLDWSGSITESILVLILQQEKEVRNRLLKRVVYDELGNPEWIIPLPEFSHLYGSNYEDQVQRVAANLQKLAPFLVSQTPILGGIALTEVAPQVFRLISAITNDEIGPSETWQITEAKRLLLDTGLMRRVLARYGPSVPEAEWYLKNEYLNESMKAGEREMRTFALRAILGQIESRETKARVGYFRPGWTPREAINNGLMVLVNGARLINQQNSQHYLFTQAYSLIMAEINKRTPGDPRDKPVALVMDEVYSLLSIPGMAEEVGMLSPLYRSRKLELYVVLQALSQLASPLREQIWSIGNVVCFAVSNFDEAYEVGQQLLAYNPQTTKLPAKTVTRQPVLEPDRGQYLTIANKIQRFKHRECIMRRFESERLLDKYVTYVAKTRDNPTTPLEEPLEAIKERLLRERGVLVKDALEKIKQRELWFGVRAAGTPPKIKT